MHSIHGNSPLKENKYFNNKSDKVMNTRKFHIKYGKTYSLNSGKSPLIKNSTYLGHCEG